MVSLEGNKEKEVEYMLTTGVIASSMEHEVFEQLTDAPSLSAIKILEEANKREMPIHNITKDNISEKLAKLEVSESVKRNIQMQ